MLKVVVGVLGGEERLLATHELAQIITPEMYAGSAREGENLEVHTVENTAVVEENTYAEEPKTRADGSVKITRRLVNTVTSLAPGWRDMIVEA